MPFSPERPYNDLPDLPPAVEVETRATLKACTQARASIAALAMATRLIPHDTILINALPLLEAQASSEIENIVTTTDRLFQFASHETDRADPATKEALRYRTALREGYESLRQRPLSTRTAIEICRTIKNVDLDIRATPGTALFKDHTGRVVYTPPEGEALLREKLARWERYIHEAEDIDPLIRMALMHYQFEAIHPFTDGNGRTGRILNLLYLVEQDLLPRPVLYLSRYIIRHKLEYYQRLLRVTTEGEWEAWILYMLAAIRETSDWTTAKIEAIRDLFDRTAAAVRERLPRFYSRELVEMLFIQPYCRIGSLVEAGIAGRQSASVYLRALAEAGLVEEMKIGREKLFLNLPLLSLLREP